MLLHAKIRLTTLQMFTEIYEYRVCTLLGNQGAGISNLWGLHVTHNPCKNQLQSEKKERRFSVLFKYFFKFPNNFCGDFRLPVILVKFVCMLRGTPCDTGISYTFCTICSV